MKISIVLKPSEIEGLVRDMMNGKILGSLSRGTSELAYKIMEAVMATLQEMDGECETMRPWVERFFSGFTETEGLPEEEQKLYELD
jgi:hypothetical protein